MTIFKCKMCSAPMEVTDGMTVCECEYCGTKQTLPKLDNDSRLNLYDRANHFRRNNEYDKAMGIYEKILNEDKTDAEAYWSLVLCRYGIEYVEDPSTHKRVPTVNRAQFTSVYDDDNYKLALEYADTVQRQVYEDEANALNEIQKGILAISQKEEPFDVFICYKETDNDGRRTRDSVLATDLYHQLTNEGFKVFFSRITLEDKLGTAYEPYIFAALNSAKVMVVLGTKPEFFNAVWVKNEWSRYLALIKQGQSKMLIPAYRDMDPYDLPEEFSHLQAQDMSKLGFMQDLVRGIKKIAGEEETQTQVKKNENSSKYSNELNSLLKRMYMFIEDNEWERADEYCERILDIEPECAEAYLGKLLIENMAWVRRKPQLEVVAWDIKYNDNENYEKTLRFADESLKNEIYGFIYGSAMDLIDFDRYEDNCIEICDEKLGYCDMAIELLKTIPSYKDVDNQIEICKKKIEDLKIKKEDFRKDGVLADGKSRMTGEEISSYEEAIKIFERIPGWKDADEQIEICNKKIENLKKDADKYKKYIETIIYENRMVSDKDLKDYGKLSSMYKELGDINDSQYRCEKNMNIFDIEEKIKLKENELKKQQEIYDKNAHKIFGEGATLKKQAKEEIPELNYAIIQLKNDESEIKDELSETMLLAMRGMLNNAYGSLGMNLRFELLEKEKKQKTVGPKEYTEVMAEFRTYGSFNDCECYKFSPFLYAMNATVSAGSYHTVGLRRDGTVVVTEHIDNEAWENTEFGQYEVTDWTDIVSVSAGTFHTVGLRRDGTVVATKINSSSGWDRGQCEVEDWTDIVSISAGNFHTVGLRRNGTVVATKFTGPERLYRRQCEVEDWTDIVSVSAGSVHTVGLRRNGTVVAAGFTRDGCEVTDWTDIVSVSAGSGHTVGLRRDGTVVAVGDNDNGQCEVTKWRNIVAVSAGGGYTVGLRRDGTVVAVGSNYVGQCEVTGWTDIVAVSAGGGHTVGLRKDGTVVVTEYIGDEEEYIYQGQCEVSTWSNIAFVPTLHLPENWGVK